MIYYHEFKFDSLDKAREKQESLTDQGHQASLQYKGSQVCPTDIVVKVRFNW